VRSKRLTILGLLAGVVLAAIYYVTRPVERITLLPQQDGTPSAIVVQSRTGTTSVLDRPYSVATVTDSRIGTAQTDEAAVKARYNEVFAALPERPRSYMLFFGSGGTRLTPESERYFLAVLKVLTDLKDLPAPELTVIGHADEVGSTALNDELSHQRAASVVAMLSASGIDTARASIVGRGSREPLVPREKGLAEERNRRVEIRLK
jgi:outer membrane protein OmpA-like peptidoglycan-associated protein